MASRATKRKKAITLANGIPEPLIVERQKVVRKKSDDEYKRQPTFSAGRYPWFKLKKGESFFVPVEAGEISPGKRNLTTKAGGVRSTTRMKTTIDSAFGLIKYHHPDKTKGMKFLSIVTEYQGREGVRVWRIE